MLRQFLYAVCWLNCAMAVLNVLTDGGMVLVGLNIGSAILCYYGAEMV